MTSGLILAIDQGTTNTKALAFDGDGRVVSEASSPMTVHYPKPGWAEQSALDIWASVRHVVALVVEKTGSNFDSIAISNQRETLVAWDARTGAPLAPAITWQCRRSADQCEAVRASGFADAVEAKTGLGLDPLFPASKITWLLQNSEDVRRAGAQRTLRLGTVDAWLLWNFTSGDRHATDHSNASRTQLFDTERLRWDAELLEIFGVPEGALPEVCASDSEFGQVATSTYFVNEGTPIHAVLGDSHAALFGHGVRKPGVVKSTYGTGSSLMTLTPLRTRSSNGLSSTIAWSMTGVGVSYALEGNISVSGQAAAFVAELLGLDGSATLADLANTVADSNGVTFVPALVGLGAPYWAPEARGLFSGLALGTKPAHLAYATIEAIAQQVADVFEAMQRDLNTPLHEVSADGGASRNDALMQMQADLSACPVRRSHRAEASAMGVAMMAAEALGRPMPPPTDHSLFVPRMDALERAAARSRWSEAIGRTLWKS